MSPLTRLGIQVVCFDHELQEKSKKKKMRISGFFCASQNLREWEKCEAFLRSIASKRTVPTGL